MRGERPAAPPRRLPRPVSQQHLKTRMDGSGHPTNSREPSRRAAGTAAKKHHPSLSLRRWCLSYYEAPSDSAGDPLRRVVANIGQGAVPKVDPCLDAATCGTQGALGSMWRVRHQTFQQLPSHGAVTVAIQFDMPVDVVDEIAQAGVVMSRIIERPEKSAEHLWNYVLATVEECRQDLFRRG